MDDEQRRHAEALLRINQRRLYKLEQQAALTGADTPPHILIEIDDLRIEVTRLEAELERCSPHVKTGTVLLHSTLSPLTPRINLPAPATVLVDRTHEVAEVGELLRRADVRLVTLTGPAGVGKTRLAIRVAIELLDEYRDGVWFVDLAPITDMQLVLPTIAQILGMKEMGGQTVLESLKMYLRDRHLILLLDNFEQVIDAVPLIGELLTSSPGLKLLVTSRELLHIYGEYEITIPPLGLPDPSYLHSLDQILQSDAVRLFATRGQAARPNFVVSNENAAAVATICMRLDGLPLAIELAAARVKLFAPSVLLGQLDSRLKTLTGGARNLPSRQQSLRSTLDWSYHLLDVGEQMLFAHLSVFLGGCSIRAAEAVCKTDDDMPLDVLEGIIGLVDKSLLRQDDKVDEQRFVMLETVREYALERLAASGKVDVLRERHFAYYLALAEQAEPELSGPKQVKWLEQLEQEHDNLRAALRWALDSKRREMAVRLGGVLWRLWYIHGHFSEGRRWLDEILTHRASAAMSAQAKLLRGAGVLANVQNDYQLGMELLEEGLVLYRALEDKNGIASMLLGLSWAAHDQGAFSQAETFLRESLTLFRELEDRRGVANTLNNLGSLAQDQGDHERAKQLLEESLALRREVDDKQGIAMSLLNLGDVARSQGEYTQAIALLQESLVHLRESGDRYPLANTLSNLGSVAYYQGEYPRSAAFYWESLALFQELRDRRGIAECLEGLAAAIGKQGHLEKAALLYGATEVLRTAIGAPLTPAERSHYEHMVSMIRTQLDEAIFAAAWEAGHLLTLEQVIAEAIEQREVN